MLRRTTYEYPRSKYWVFLSSVFVVVSLVFSFYAFWNDPVLIELFLVYTFVLAAIFFFAKLHLYSRKRLVGFEEAEASEGASRSIYILMAALLAALFLPFALLLILDPRGWFMSITGFIAGINIPEIVLYLYSGRSGLKGSKVKA